MGLSFGKNTTRSGLVISMATEGTATTDQGKTKGEEASYVASYVRKEESIHKRFDAQENIDAVNYFSKCKMQGAVHGTVHGTVHDMEFVIYITLEEDILQPQLVSSDRNTSDNSSNTGNTEKYPNEAILSYNDSWYAEIPEESLMKIYYDMTNIDRNVSHGNKIDHSDCLTQRLYHIEKTLIQMAYARIIKEKDQSR